MKPPTEFDPKEHDDAEGEPIGQWEAIGLGVAGVILFTILFVIGAAALVFVP